MPDNFAVFGVRSDDLDAVRVRVEKIFGEPMHLRDGNDFGFYYSGPLGVRPNIFSVQRNLIQNEDEEFVWMKEHAEFKTIIQISDSDDVEGQRKALEEDPELQAVLIEFRDFIKDPPKPLLD